LAEAFFESVLIVADWVELMCNVDLFCLEGVRWFGGLTRVFAGEIVEKKQSEPFGKSGSAWR